MLARIDAFLLDKTQKFCDKFQRLTGLTKFQPQKWAIILSLLFLWAMVFATGLDVVLALFALLQTFWVVSISRDTEKDEKAFLRGDSLKFCPWYLPGARLSILLVSCLCGIEIFFAGPDIVVKLFACSQGCVMAWVYISACLPRPPSKSKMREWAEKGVMWLRDQLPPAPLPIPIAGR